MANAIRQVHNYESRYPSAGIIFRESRGLDELKGRRGDKRRYPGEAEAYYLDLALNVMSSRQRRAFLTTLSTLREVVRRMLKGKSDQKAMDQEFRIRKKLERAIRWSDAVAVIPGDADLHRTELLVAPRSWRGQAALSLLLLEWRLDRLRDCVHCGRRFYARFKHQRFCRNSKSECQWNHYHSPEWRKKHREQNRKHQREYRKRTFGKRG